MKKKLQQNFTLEYSIEIPQNYWSDLLQKDIKRLCEFAGAKIHSETSLILPFLNGKILADIKNRHIFEYDGANLIKCEEPLKKLIVLVYLLNVSRENISNEIVGLSELKSFSFFRGPHELRTHNLLQKFGNDKNGFCKAAERVGGQPADYADCAYKFLPFPKIVLYYLLWEGDEDFEPEIKILFDRSIECHLQADAIWGVVNLVSEIVIGN